MDENEVSAILDRAKMTKFKTLFVDLPDDVDQPEAAEQKKRYGPKKAEPPAVAPVRRQRDSAADQGTQNTRKPRSKAACEKKSKPE